MTSCSFFVVADRGRMKAFRLENARGRGTTAVLLDEIELKEAGAKYADLVTDRAGEFPSNQAMGTAHSSGERLTLETENQTRLFRRLAEKLAEWLGHYKPEAWAFAAPSEINGAILEGLTKDFKERLGRNLRQDLVNLPVADLLRHLEG